MRNEVKTKDGTQVWDVHITKVREIGYLVAADTRAEALEIGNTLADVDLDFEEPTITSGAHTRHGDIADDAEIEISKTESPLRWKEIKP